MKNSAPMPRRPLCQFISAVHAACIMSSETQKARPTGKSTEGMLESEAKFSFAMLPLLEPRVMRLGRERSSTFVFVFVFADQTRP